MRQICRHLLIGQCRAKLLVFGRAPERGLLAESGTIARESTQRFSVPALLQGWPTDTYLEPGHPLQERVIAVVSELGEQSVEPVGVDGCGAPVLRTTARAMSLIFARLGSDPAFAEVRDAMHRYPALVASNGEGDTSIATAINAVAKGGAQGCIGVSVDSRLGVAAKSWDGLMDIAEVAAVAALDEVNELSTSAAMYLEKVGRPDVVGGGQVVGSTEPRLELVFV